MLFDTTQVALQGAISGAAKRHEALAANLANANTPGYQRVDVDFHGTLAAAMSRGAGARAALETAGFAVERDMSIGAVQADGSTIDSDSEAAKLSENALEQQIAVQVAQTRLHILESAMGVGGR
jgi:flagellar basal-body rod protein FlgB